MNIRCCMLLLFLVAGSVLPNETQALRLPNLTKRNHHHPMVLRPLPSQTPAPRPLAQLSLPSPRQPIQIYPRSIPASSVTTPTPSEKKVEQFAKKLRDEMEAQERVLNIYITTIQKKHAAVEKNLKRVRGVLSGLRNEIANATKYVAQYQGEERTQTTESNLVSGEYTKSRKMYEDEKQNLKFEKEFLDAILRYIKLRKSHKC